jgi:DNA polymerase
VTDVATDTPPPPATPTVVRGDTDGANCAECPFAVDGRPSHPVRGIGPENPRFVIVGEGPGAEEVRRGVPFAGPTGQLLDRGLRETNVDRNLAWVTNATLCPPLGKLGKDPKVRKQAAKCCQPRLERELMERPDIPVLVLGDVAAATLLEGATTLPITKIAGAHFEVDVDGSGVRSIIPSVHPAAILRSSGDGDKGPEKTGSHVADLAYWSLKWDILKVKNLADGKDIRLRMRVGEELFIELKDPNRARELVWERLCAARDTGRLTIDYETYVDDPERNFALQAFVAKIRLLSLASDGKACCVLWDLLDPVMVEEYGKVLADPNVTKAWHNGQVYDGAVSQNQWYRFTINGPTEDTLLGQHVAWPGAKKTLQHVACQYRAIEPWKSEFRDAGDSLEDEAVYSAKDAFATDATIAPTLFWIKRYGVEKVYDVDKIKGAFATKMHLRGYYVDPDVNAEIKKRLKTVIDEANTFMDGRYREIADRVHAKLAAERAKTQRKKDPEFYADRIRVREAELAKEIEKGKFEFSASNDWHAAAFLKAAGVPLWATTKGGRTATGASVLEKFANYPEVDELLRLRANEQLFDTFVVRMYEWTQDSAGKWRPPFVQEDGRVHPIWKPTQISGRYGSEEPASSNWSMGDETNEDPRRRLPNIRRQLVAPPRRAIVAFDKAQLEARSMAVQSGDPFLCGIFRDGKDIHHEFGVIAFPKMGYLDKASEEYNHLRDTTKRVEYGAIYGGADATVHRAIAAEVPSLAGPRGFQMIREAIATMKKAVPGVFAWQQRLLYTTSQPPYTLRSFILGRRRVFPLGNPPPTDIANNPNQFFGADVMDLGLVEIMKRLEKYDDAFPILHQHDAIYFECWEDDAERLAKDVDEAFYIEVKGVSGDVIPFPNDLKIGYAYHVEPSDKQKAKHPQLVWDVGRPGLSKFKVKK